MNEQENLALKTGFMGEKKRDASSSIRGFVYQNLLAIEELIKENTDRVFCEYVEDITSIDKNEDCKIIQAKYYSSTMPLSMEKEIFREMYCQYLKLINDGNLHSVIPVLSIFSQKNKNISLPDKATAIGWINDNSKLATIIFLEGDPKQLIKIECIANNLPYYVCLVQPKEGILSTYISKRILLFCTMDEINERLEKVWEYLQNSHLDRDDLFAQGNTIRNIMEYAFKYFCVITDLPINIQQRYGHIMLKDLKKELTKIEIEIPQGLIITANNLSHDSGKKYSLENIREFCKQVKYLINSIQDKILSIEDLI